MATANDLAASIAYARRSHKHLIFSGAMACPSAGEAYRIQEAVIQKLGASVAGWKVGIGPDGLAMAAPILNVDVIADDAAFALSGDLACVKVEAELALRLGRDLPPRAGKNYQRDEILEAVSEAFCGIELVATRFKNETEADFPTKLADNFAHAAYAIGSGSAEFSTLDLSNLPCRVTRDGHIVSDGLGLHPLGDPLLPVIAWASAQCDRIGGLRAGQFITTGTLITPFEVSGAAQLHASLTGIGAASLRIIASKTQA